MPAQVLVADMRQRLAGCRIDIGADVRLRQHVADRVVAEGLESGVGFAVARGRRPGTRSFVHFHRNSQAELVGLIAALRSVRGDRKA